MTRWLLATDLDGTLVGDPRALEALNAELAPRRDRMVLAYVTGRSLHSTLGLLRESCLLKPDWILSGVGTALHQGPDWKEDSAWMQRISRQWSAPRVREIASRFPELGPQLATEQSEVKCSFTLHARDARRVLRALEEALARSGTRARVIYSSDRDLDILPDRAGKGNAVSYLARRLGIAGDAVVACGDSGNDREMLGLEGPAVLVGNARPEVRGLPGAYQARAAFAEGVREGLRHYGWL